MKNKFLKLTLIASVAMLFVACEKDEKQVIYEGGTSPVLKSSATAPLVLLKDRLNDIAISFTWTNPDYKFNTGVSSQNVNYIIQIDSAGRNFSSPKLQETMVVADLSKAFTVKEFNSFMSKMEFEASRQHTVDIRIKSTLTNGSAVLYSNIVTVRVTPYLDFIVEPPGTPGANYLDGNLWVIGDCFGTPNWTNPLPSPQDVNHKFTRIDILHYELVINFVGGGGYKMIQTQGVWGTQYHALTAGAALDGEFEKRDADPQFASPGPGRYKIQVNFQTGKYKLTPQ
jgi:starch-binding outer membrane protein SusE/F